MSLKSNHDVIYSSNISNGCRRAEISERKCLSDNACGVGGKCEDFWTEARCKCPLNKIGPSCQLDRVRFFI